MKQFCKKCLNSGWKKSLQIRTLKIKKEQCECLLNKPNRILKVKCIGCYSTEYKHDAGCVGESKGISEIKVVDGQDICRDCAGNGFKMGRRDSVTVCDVCCGFHVTERYKPKSTGIDFDMEIRTAMDAIHTHTVGFTPMIHPMDVGEVREADEPMPEEEETF